METKYDYLSVSAALSELEELGYRHDFNVDFEALLIPTVDYEIDYLFRYEGLTNPSDESTVYGIRNTISGLKGVFVVGDLSTVEGKKRDVILNFELKAKSNNV